MGESVVGVGWNRSWPRTCQPEQGCDRDTWQCGGSEADFIRHEPGRACELCGGARKAGRHQFPPSSASAMSSPPITPRPTTPAVFIIVIPPPPPPPPLPPPPPTTNPPTWPLYPPDPI